MKKQKFYKIFVAVVLSLFCIFITGYNVKSYYDAKRIYDEIKPAIIDEDRMKRREENSALILLYHNVTDEKKNKF